MRVIDIDFCLVDPGRSERPNLERDLANPEMD
jgi:hypothetical protein